MLGGMATIGVITASIVAWFVNLTRPPDAKERMTTFGLDVLQADIIQHGNTVERLSEQLDAKVPHQPAGRRPTSLNGARTVHLPSAVQHT